MIKEARFRVINNSIQVFGGEAIIPPGVYRGAIEYYVIRSNGMEERIPATALIRIDRRVLEAQGARIVPNLPAVDFGIFEHIKRGNIVVN
jgi:hypothetical protein